MTDADQQILIANLYKRNNGRGTEKKAWAVSVWLDGFVKSLKEISVAKLVEIIL
ncbi:MAG: hypothetical protein KJ687_05850 [Proteobacteria bacterium]|nr:hypothetical protein [Pseudomonadota bacterium]